MTPTLDAHDQWEDRQMKNAARSLSGILAEQHLDYELFFVTEVLKLRSLHYGFWDEPPERPSLDLSELREAQARYTERLLDHIPDGAEQVLDVGAGIGDNARAMAERGLRVHSISPDRNHRRYFTTMREPDVTFEECRFEDFSSYREFDLLLFSESHNYIDHRVGLEQSRRFVKPGGHLLIASMFRYDNRQRFPDDFDLEQLPYIDTAREYGFVPDRLVDITDNVLPTMQMVHDTLRTYVRPFLEMGASYLKTIAPWKAWLLSRASRPQLEKLARVYSYYLERTDPSYFQDHIRYAVLRLRDDRT
jgi:cyclopropane fatty-acyl-phospholipid synthase-like methyltransferase